MSCSPACRGETAGAARLLLDLWLYLLARDLDVDATPLRVAVLVETRHGERIVYSRGRGDRGTQRSMAARGPDGTPTWLDLTPDFDATPRRDT